MSQPMTTNPLLIAFINMSVVFGVLFGISMLIKLIALVDPTRQRNT